MKRRVVAELDADGKVVLGPDLPGWLRTFLGRNSFALASWLRAPGICGLPPTIDEFPLRDTEPHLSATDENVRNLLDHAKEAVGANPDIGSWLIERATQYYYAFPNWTARFHVFCACRDLGIYQFAITEHELLEMLQMKSGGVTCE